MSVMSIDTVPRSAILTGKPRAADSRNLSQHSNYPSCGHTWKRSAPISSPVIFPPSFKLSSKISASSTK